MKTLVVTVPLGPLDKTIESCLSAFGSSNDGGTNYLFSPLGALRVGTYAENMGCDDIEIYDVNSLRGTDEELIKNFKEINPTVVGLSAPLSQCYPNLRRIAKILRKLFPDIWIVTGGAIANSANVVLEKTDTDICVVGDGEIPFFKLLKYFKTHPTNKNIDFNELSEIPGLAYLDKNEKLKVTGNGEALSADEASGVHYPDYDRLAGGLQKFKGNGELIHKFFGTIEDYEGFREGLLEEQMYPAGIEFFNKYKGYKIGQIMSAQGCVARCTFCQRYMKGYRPYKMTDFETHLIELKEKYNVRLLWLSDDNSLSNKKQGYEMARIIKKHGMSWTAGGVRANTCSFEDLKFYKEHGLLAIRFGIESGSQEILDIMEKKIKKEDSYNALLYCSELGISVATNMFLLGMPGETMKTVEETAEYSGKLRYMVGKDWNVGDSVLAMSIPGTPLYEYSQQIGAIGKTVEEEEDYLLRTAEESNKDILNYVNKTDSTYKEVYYWTYFYRYSAKRHFVKEIFNSNKPLKAKFLEFYTKCYKAAINDVNYFMDKRYKRSFLKRAYQSALQAAIVLSVSFFPRSILFGLLRTVTNRRFKALWNANRVSEGKQKYNCYVERKETDSNFKITKDYIEKSDRSIQLSLRYIVAANRKKLKPATTDEEKGLEILALGQ